MAIRPCMSGGKTDEEKLSIVSDYYQSGMTVVDWCRDHNISKGQFYSWQRKFQRDGLLDNPTRVRAIDEGEDQHDIVKIEIKGEGAQSPFSEILHPSEKGAAQTPVNPMRSDAQSDPTVMEINMDGVNLRITNSVSAEILTTVLRLLRGASC